MSTTATTTRKPPCWETFVDSMPAWMVPHWETYCTTSWTPAFWVMSPSCGWVYYTSNASSAIRKCKNATKQECGIFDENRARCITNLTTTAPVTTVAITSVAISTTAATTTTQREETTTTEA